MLKKGLLAGAAGTFVLDAVSYADMFARARPASELPATVIQKLAARLGVESLADGDGDARQNRRSAAGALSGYGVGLGAGAGYAALRPLVANWLPWPIAGVVLGAATLVVSEGSATALGATDWSKWSTADWIADIVPRTLYGLTVAYVCETFSDAW